MNVEETSYVDLMRKFFFGDVCEDVDAIEEKLEKLGIETMTVWTEFDAIIDKHINKINIVKSTQNTPIQVQ